MGKYEAPTRSVWEALNPSPAARRWLYGVLLAAQPLVVAYGLVTDAEAALWLGVASAVLGLSVAFPNTPKPDEKE